MRVWLAALPLLPGLGVLGLAGLRSWRQLSPAALQAFGWFAVTQQVAALLTPEPLLASVLAAARSALILGLLGLGSRLGSAGALWPALLGGAGVALTALVTSEQFRLGGLLSARLAHPYMTEVSLGILGSLGVLLSLFGPLPRGWKAVGALGFGAVLLLSGSRGPLLMLGAGLAAGLWLLLGSWRARLTAVTAGVGLMVLGGALLTQGPAFASRLLTLDSTGRDLVWLNALGTVQQFPLGGVGPYLLGSTLAEPVQTCTLWPQLAEAGYTCPAWLSALGQPWLIAHNGLVQQLGEAGVIGTAGLLVLWATLLVAAAGGRDPAAAALIAALLTGNLLDNTTLVPSPFFAEVFWLAAGVVLSRRPADTSAQAAAQGGTGRPVLWGAGLLTVMGFPLLALAAPRAAAPSPLQLETLSADTLVVPDAPYRVYVRLRGAAGSYRLALRTCRTVCQTVAVQPFEVGQGPAEVWLEGQVPALNQRMSLLLLPGVAAPASLRPLAERQWTVRRGP